MWCEFTGKKSYDSHNEAVVARKNVSNHTNLTVYRCEHCSKFHLGRDARKRSKVPAKRKVKL